MATKIEYAGPPDQVNRDVARETGSAVLEPGQIVEVSAELAERLLASSDHWQPVSDLDTLSVEQLRDLAREAGIKGFSKLSHDELVDALRNPSPDPEEG